MERLLTLPAVRPRSLRLPRARWTVALAGALFVGTFALSTIRSNADAPLVLLVVPVAVLAVTYGLRGGVLASAVAVALTAGSLSFAGDGVTPLGHLSRDVAFVTVGVLLGWLTDHRRALVAALERHQELALDAIATIDFDGRFESVNPAWTRILGYSEDELVGREFIELVHLDDVGRTLAEAARMSESGESSVGFRNRYLAKDGSYRWLEWMATPARDEQRYYTVARDVTEKKNVEESLERYQERLECEVLERTNELEEARLETLRRLAYAAEYRDDTTHEHTERVGRAAALLARQLGLPDEEVAVIRQAAPLHDVGKLGISDAILLKRGALAPDERNLMKTHTTVGAQILAGSGSPALRAAEEIALTHHEWWDGSGYPFGRSGTEIPLAGRIVAVADVFDALTHVRPYKPAWTVARALEEIRSLAGIQFDPAVVEALEHLDHLHLLAPVQPALAQAV